jgi:hypothetical protein
MVNGTCQNGCGSVITNPPAGQEACMFRNWYGCAEWWTTCPVGYSCINNDCVPGTNPPTTTSITTTPGQTAACLDVKAYSTSWTAYTLTQLGQLRAGAQIYFCARGSTNVGSFNKAQFTINGTVRPETSTIRPATTNEFCDLYSIPANTFTFSVNAKLNHVTLGWIQ